jgi:hypothetical protein
MYLSDVQDWLQCFMAAGRQAVVDTDQRLVAAMHPDVPRPMLTGKCDLQRVDEGENAGSTYLTVMEPPSFTPFQRTSSTFFTAFVLYGS